MVASALDAATDVFDRARGLLALDQAPHAAEVREDVRRAALTMSVSALDTYIHWRIRGTSLVSPLPRALANVKVTFRDLLEMGEKSLVARRDDRSDRPRTRARNIMNERLLTMTFQSYTSVATGFKMLGVTGGWDAVAGHLATTKSDLKGRLDAIVHRRNVIVHEGALRRLVRPQQVTRVSLSRAQVDADIDWLEGLVSAMDAVVV